MFKDITNKKKMFFLLLASTVSGMFVVLWEFPDIVNLVKFPYNIVEIKGFKPDRINTLTKPTLTELTVTEPTVSESTESFQTTAFYNRTFLILYWGFPWGLKSYVPAEGRPAGSPCEVTHDKKRLKEADLVIFHFTNMHDRDMPWKFYRHPDQLFVWNSAENPAVLLTVNQRLTKFDNFFNWTMTYRRDSDVTQLYGYRSKAIAQVSRGKKAIDEIMAKKKKLALWIVSQCRYTHGAKLRMKYSKELRKAGLNFDGCGKCFKKGGECPRDMSLLKKIVEKYKFYLAFENSLHCKDYITEKFWYNSLFFGAVPIVWGPSKEDILAAAPLDSFIFVEDFESPEKLVKYLKYLDSNDTEYRKYFRWREDESMTDEKMIEMTKSRYPDVDLVKEPRSLCQTLVENKERKIIKSLSEYFMQSNPKECIG